MAKITALFQHWSFEHSTKDPLLTLIKRIKIAFSSIKKPLIEGIQQQMGKRMSVTLLNVCVPFKKLHYSIT